MTWPASTTTLQKVLEQTNVAMLRTRDVLNNISTASETQPVKVSRLVNAIRSLDALEEQLAIMASYGADVIPYVRSEFRDPALDVAAEFSAVRNAGQQMRTWLVNALPVDIAVTQVNNGAEVDNTLSSAALAQFRTNAATFSALIS